VTFALRSVASLDKYPADTIPNGSTDWAEKHALKEKRREFRENLKRI
jgi:hypothetical protein